MSESGQWVARAIENPTDQITLRDALVLALMESPELAAFNWEIRAREARLFQVGRRANPVVSAFVQDVGGTPGITGAADPIQPQTTLELSQLIELGGKRAARQKLAALNRDLAAWDYEAARLDVFTRVARAYVDVLASQETVALTEQTTRLVAQVRQTVGLRVEAGVVSPIEKTRADVAFAAIGIESDRARRALDADRRRLATLWGSTEARFKSAAGDLTVLPPFPSPDQLEQHLIQNPEIARWAAEISQRQAALALERTARVPDVTVSAGYRRFNAINGTAFLIGGSVQLPLFDRNRGGIQEANERLNKARAEQLSAVTRVRSALAEAYRALSSAHDEVSGLTSNVLPGARSAFDAVSEGFRFGKFGYLDVLDAQRTLVTFQGQYLRALAEYQKATVDVERLIGAPLADAASLPPIVIK